MQDFDVDAAEKFIAEATVPIVTIFDQEPENQVYVSKFFKTPNAKVPDGQVHILRSSDDFTHHEFVIRRC